jgi:hypothetical protein
VGAEGGLVDGEGGAEFVEPGFEMLDGALDGTKVVLEIPGKGQGRRRGEEGVSEEGRRKEGRGRTHAAQDQPSATLKGTRSSK